MWIWRSSFFSFSLNFSESKTAFDYSYVMSSFFEYFESMKNLFSMLCLHSFRNSSFMLLAILRACKLNLFWNLKSLDKISSDDIFNESCMLCRQTMTKKIMNFFYVRDFLRSLFLNAQFMLYALTVCYDIHITLVHVNARWIGTIVYRVIYDEMFVRKSLIHARMFEFCRNVLQRHYILQFMILFRC